MSNNNGLTNQEQEVMDDLMDAYGKYIKLEKQHPDDMREFVDAIHAQQGLLAMRVIRRCHPLGWATYREGKNESPKSETDN